VRYLTFYFFYFLQGASIQINHDNLTFVSYQSTIKYDLCSYDSYSRSMKWTKKENQLSSRKSH